LDIVPRGGYRWITSRNKKDMETNSPVRRLALKAKQRYTWSTMERYDLIVIGGGIAGLGVAAEASRRSIKTLVLEARQCGAATSNNTLRIIHGGFRYLQHLQLSRLIRSLNDQSAVLRDFAQAVQPLPCLMPLARYGLKSKIPVRAASLLYGLAMKACRSPLPPPTVYSPQDMTTLAPLVSELSPHGALCWHDVLMTHPEIIALALKDHITQNGGVIQENCPVAEIKRKSGGFHVVTSTGAHLTGTQVINALGPWLDSIAVPDALRGNRPEWCKGFNLIVKRQIHPTHAIGIQSKDGRLFFCVPRGSHTAIGTWYTPARSIPDHHTEATPSHDEIAAFIHSFNAAYPIMAISVADIEGIDCGFLPMKKLSPQGPVLYGSEILHAAHGYGEIMSTKYTTFRSQAQRSLEKVTASL